VQKSFITARRIVLSVFLEYKKIEADHSGSKRYSLDLFLDGNKKPDKEPVWVTKQDRRNRVRRKL